MYNPFQPRNTRPVTYQPVFTIKHRPVSDEDLNRCLIHLLDIRSKLFGKTPSGGYKPLADTLQHISREVFGFTNPLTREAASLKLHGLMFLLFRRKRLQSARQLTDNCYLMVGELLVLHGKMNAASVRKAPVTVIATPEKPATKENTKQETVRKRKPDLTPGANPAREAWTRGGARTAKPSAPKQTIAQPEPSETTAESTKEFTKRKKTRNRKRKATETGQNAMGTQTNDSLPLHDGSQDND